MDKVRIMAHDVEYLIGELDSCEFQKARLHEVVMAHEQDIANLWQINHNDSVQIMYRDGLINNLQSDFNKQGRKLRLFKVVAGAAVLVIPVAFVYGLTVSDEKK